jgi:hypothetical protein
MSRCATSKCFAALVSFDLSLNQGTALTPAELVQAHLNLDGQTMHALRIIVK